jgi:hypothetical protein
MGTRSADGGGLPGRGLGRVCVGDRRLPLGCALCMLALAAGQADCTSGKGLDPPSAAETDPHVPHSDYGRAYRCTDSPKLTAWTTLAGYVHRTMLHSCNMPRRAELAHVTTPLWQQAMCHRNHSPTAADCSTHHPTLCPNPAPYSSPTPFTAILLQTLTHTAAASTAAFMPCAPPG